jgi:hypothetical protein
VTGLRGELPQSPKVTEVLITGNYVSWLKLIVAAREYHRKKGAGKVERTSRHEA